MQLVDSDGFGTQASQNGPGGAITALDPSSPFGPLYLYFDGSGTLTQGVMFLGYGDGTTQGPFPVADLPLDCQVPQGPEEGICTGFLTLQNAPADARTANVSYADNGVPENMLLIGSASFGPVATQVGGAGTQVTDQEDGPFGPLQWTFDHAGVLTQGTVAYMFPDERAPVSYSLPSMVVSCNSSDGGLVCSAAIALPDPPAGSDSAFISYPDTGVPAGLLLTASSGFSQAAVQVGGAGGGLNALDEDQPYGPLHLTFDRAGSLSGGTVAFGFPDGTFSQGTPLQDKALDCDHVDFIGCNGARAFFAMDRLDIPAGAEAAYFNLHMGPSWSLVGWQGQEVGPFSIGAQDSVAEFDDQLPFGPYELAIDHAGVSGPLDVYVRFGFADGTEAPTRLLGSAAYDAPCTIYDSWHPFDANLDGYIQFGEFTQTRAALLNGGGATFSQYTQARSCLLQGRSYFELFPDAYGSWSA